MSSTCECAHNPATWAELVEASCQRNGMRLTPLRRRVLDIFSESVAPLGAYAILEELSRREGKQVAPPTVYRTLDFFLDHGFVHKFETLNAYGPCKHLGHAHHGMLLICESCGRSEEVDDQATMAAISESAEAAGFTPRRVMIEAQGLCRRCTDATKKESGAVSPY